MNKHIIRIISFIVLIIFTANSSSADQQEKILPIPRWVEGSAVVTGTIVNFQKDGEKKTASVYPRSSLGRYADLRHGVAPVDSTGRFSVDVHLYQTHQPCFMTLPGYYGLIYLSPGDTVSVTVDQSKRRDHDFHGDDGSVIFYSGADADINNMLASNFGHDAVWDCFHNAGGWQKSYVSNEDVKRAIMAYRDKRLRHIDSNVSSPRLKELLRLKIDGDAFNDLLSAPMYLYQTIVPDTAYYSFIKEMDVCDPIYRWASEYDGIVRNLSRLSLDDNPFRIQYSHYPACIFEELIASGKLTPEESAVIQERIKYNPDRIPADVAESRRKRVMESITNICDSLTLNKADSVLVLKARRIVENEKTGYGKIEDTYLSLLANLSDSIPDVYSSILEDDDFGREAEASISSNIEEFKKIMHEYEADITQIRKRRERKENLHRFSDITGIRSGEVMENVRIYPYTDMIDRGDTVPENIFRSELKDLSAVPLSFLRTQNDFLKGVLAKAVSNVSQMSPDDDAESILINLTEKHKGKMVLIDIWGTWCGACLAAIKEHEQYKERYADDVAFVYLADETSPEAGWKERIKTITGDHYRLPQPQMDVLRQRFSFRGYPSYILIDKNGEIVHTDYFHSLPDLLDRYL